MYNWNVPSFPLSVKAAKKHSRSMEYRYLLRKDRYTRVTSWNFLSLPSTPLQIDNPPNVLPPYTKRDIQYWLLWHLVNEHNYHRLTPSIEQKFILVAYQFEYMYLTIYSANDGLPRRSTTQPPLQRGLETGWDIGFNIIFRICGHHSFNTMQISTIVSFILLSKVMVYLI